MSEEKSGQKPSIKVQVIAVIIVAVIVLGIFISSANSGSDGQKDLRNDIENYCTDAALLRKYISNDVSIIDTSNLKDNYSDLGEENGKHQYNYAWNGKNKTTDEVVRFQCTASGTSKDDIALEWLNIDGTTVFDRESPNEQ